MPKRRFPFTISPLTPLAFHILFILFHLLRFMSSLLFVVLFFFLLLPVSVLVSSPKRRGMLHAGEAQTLVVNDTSALEALPEDATYLHCLRKYKTA